MTVLVAVLAAGAVAVALPPVPRLPRSVADRPSGATTGHRWTGGGCRWRY